MAEAEESARSIGDVLVALQGEFPDISVSKIRFLESQGLISPKRTSSGYRQFSDDDMELLRWILRQQREHYLPLKVIRARLREGDGPWAAADTDATVEVEDAAERAAPPVPPVGGADVAAAGPLPAAEAPGDDLWAEPATSAPLSRSALAREADLPEAAVSELESFGLLEEGEDGFSEEALRVARAAAEFARYGVEARHLRMYKTFAEREATFFQQVLPVTSRSEESKRQRREALADLARLGQALRLAMLRSALEDGSGD